MDSNETEMYVSVPISTHETSPVSILLIEVNVTQAKTTSVAALMII